jgi:N-acetylglucosaminyl-diphospho-decaprenol L-rhamnosyltransferase
LIAVSIVSHGHGDMVGRLVGQLLAFPEVAQIILTLNVPESVALPDDARVTVIGNAEPKGFGANHNAAFAACTQTFFCPLNPDIEFDRNPFPVLSAALGDDRVALVAPLVRSPDGKIEDSMRRFPTPGSLLMKALGGAMAAMLSGKTGGFCSGMGGWNVHAVS